jgi:hypothetical protein
MKTYLIDTNQFNSLLLVITGWNGLTTILKL